MATEKLLFLLLQHAAAPYLEMLGIYMSSSTTCATLSYFNAFFYIIGLWIFKGKIKDPYGEFMVEEHPDQQKENLNDDVNDAYHFHMLFLHKNYLTNKDIGNKNIL